MRRRQKLPGAAAALGAALAVWVAGLSCIACTCSLWGGVLLRRTVKAA